MVAHRVLFAENQVISQANERIREEDVVLGSQTGGGSRLGIDIFL